MRDADVDSLVHRWYIAAATVKETYSNRAEKEERRVRSSDARKHQGLRCGQRERSRQKQ